MIRININTMLFYLSTAINSISKRTKNIAPEKSAAQGKEDPGSQKIKSGYVVKCARTVGTPN